MTDRDARARAFVAQTRWAGADLAPLAGDASNRRYLRLTDPANGATAVLMDAPPDKGEDTRPFIAIANHLTSLGLSAPQILHADISAGFLLIEDLGDPLFARVIPQQPALEPALYEAATDVLLTLHSHPAPADLPAYDAPLMAELAALAFDWYAAGLGPVPVETKQMFLSEMQALLAPLAAQSDVLIQRDYHAENLLWRPDRSGVARVGLLDFQDAMVGHRAYDLVSLLQDARRDVPGDIAAGMIRHYTDQSGCDPGRFAAAYHLLGAQRNLRILGVFARLCIRDAKPGYIDLIPRVWDHLMTDLAHPALARVAPMILQAIPAPDPANLTRLRDQCAPTQ